MKLSPSLAVASALAVAGCAMFRDSGEGRFAAPADRPVAPAASIDAMDGERLTRRCEFAANGEKLPYRFHAPAAFEDGVRYPLVLFLHGAGERGNDNTRTLVHGVVPICRYAMKHGDAFVVAPQCPAGRKWVNTDWGAPSFDRPRVPSEELATVMELVRDIAARYPVDPSRIYVTGISMGGFGTWDIASRMPGFFAAAMPICGGVDEKTAPLYADRDLAVSFFHGSADGAVPPDYSRRMDRALSEAGKEHLYTEYPGVNHDCWTRTYANDGVLGWLFSRRRSLVGRPRL